MKISKEEAILYVGGGITASFISATVNLIKQVYIIGQNLGSAIARAFRGQSC